MTGRGMYCTKADGMITKLYAARDALSAVIDALSNEVAHIEGDNRALVEQARDLESENAALEAQAALDAKVVNCAAGVEANAILDDNYDELDHVYFTVPRHLMYALRASLAARKGE